MHEGIVRRFLFVCVAETAKRLRRMESIRASASLTPAVLFVVVSYLGQLHRSWLACLLQLTFGCINCPCTQGSTARVTWKERSYVYMTFFSLFLYVVFSFVFWCFFVSCIFWFVFVVASFGVLFLGVFCLF